MFGRKKRKTPLPVVFEAAPDIYKLAVVLIKKLQFDFIEPNQIKCVRSKNSKSRAYARIWSVPRIFLETLKMKPAYIIEVLAHYFDKLSEEEKTKVIIHELLHIPKTFSGALKSHRGRYHHVDRREVQRWFDKISPPVG